MRIRLRTLFLITTVVAIVVFTFTLGPVEGGFTLLFFVGIFATSPKKDRWKTGLLLVLILLGPGIYGWYSIQDELRQPSNGETACVVIVFTGCNAGERLKEITWFLREEISSNGGFSSGLQVIPFFGPGYIKISFDEEKLPEIEAEVRRKIAEKFPDLSVSIEGYSTSDRR